MFNERVSKALGRATAYTSLVESRGARGDFRGSLRAAVDALGAIVEATKETQDAEAYAALLDGNIEAALAAVGGDRGRVDAMIARSLDQQMSGAGILLMPRTS